MATLTATLPDGGKASRKTDRPYRYVVAVKYSYRYSEAHYRMACDAVRANGKNPETFRWFETERLRLEKQKEAGFYDRWHARSWHLTRAAAEQATRNRTGLVGIEIVEI